MCCKIFRLENIICKEQAHDCFHAHKMLDKEVIQCMSGNKDPKEKWSANSTNSNAAVVSFWQQVTLFVHSGLHYGGGGGSSLTREVSVGKKSDGETWRVTKAGRALFVWKTLKFTLRRSQREQWTVAKDLKSLVQTQVSSFKCRHFNTFNNYGNILSIFFKAPQGWFCVQQYFAVMWQNSSVN